MAEKTNKLLLDSSSQRGESIEIHLYATAYEIVLLLQTETLIIQSEFAHTKKSLMETSTGQMLDMMLVVPSVEQLPSHVSGDELIQMSLFRGQYLSPQD